MHRNCTGFSRQWELIQHQVSRPSDFGQVQRSTAHGQSYSWPVSYRASHDPRQLFVRGPYRSLQIIEEICLQSYPCGKWPPRVQTRGPQSLPRTALLQKKTDLPAPSPKGEEQVATPLS